VLQDSGHITQMHGMETLLVLGSCLKHNIICMPIPVAERSKTSDWGRSFAVDLGSNSAADVDVCLLWTLCVVR
jgi:hypothetical protein